MNPAIIGKEDVVIGFRLLGIDVFPADNPEKAKSTVEELIDKDYNLIFVTEDLAGPWIKEILEETDVSILIIPAPGVKTEIVSNMIRSSIRKALGAEIEV